MLKPPIINTNNSNSNDANVPTLDDVLSSQKEYQTLFWVPMLFQTANNAQNLIEEMLGMINNFYDSNPSNSNRRSILVAKTGVRRQQIFGDALDSSVVATRVEMVAKSDDTIAKIMATLKSHFLFRQLQDYELQDLIDSMQDIYASDGDEVIKQGEAGEAFYVLEEGTCAVSVNGERVDEIKAPTSFGDLALMYNSPRAATISATSDCVLWSLDRDFFRQAMVTSSSNQSVQISQFLSKIELFNTLGPQGLNQLARSLGKQSYEHNQYIIRQGEIGKEFYVICKGEVRVTRTGDDGYETQLATLGVGQVFGERALIRKEPRGANIISNGQVECYYLGSSDFALLLGSIVDKMNELQEFRVLKAAPVFKQFSDHRLRMLRGVLQTHNMFMGQRMVCDSLNVLIVMMGTVESSEGVKYNSATNSVIGSIRNGADKEAGAITATAEEVVIKSVARSLLQEYLNDQKNDVAEEAKTDGSGTGGSAGGSGRASQGGKGVADPEKELSELFKRRKALKESRREIVENFQSTTLLDLDIIKPLGKGSFGNVFLTRHALTHSIIALKCLDKQALVENHQQQYVKREVMALQSFHHPFIGEYYGMILSAKKIFFMLEYISGGELWSYLYKEGVHGKGPVGGLDFTQAAYYAAIVFSALEHMHLQGYVYRDLKPENLLITSNGYLKIVDFGFAKPVPFKNAKGQMQYRSFTFCGTPEYMAPELILIQGHDKSVDYWALGILIFEILCGKTPFEGNNTQRTFEKIVNSQKFLQFPRKVEPHAKSIIRRLLHPNAALRLGCLQNGGDDVREHAYFTTMNIDFEKLIKQEVNMPYLPPTPDTSGQGQSTIQELKVEPINLMEEMNATAVNTYAKEFEELEKLGEE